MNYTQKQKVIFRTNCIDSLDRTNVVQSVFGRYFLHLILKDLKLSDVKLSKENISLPTPKLSNSNLTTPNTITYTVRAMQTDKIDESYKINMYENISVIQTINIGPQTLKVGVTTWQ